VGVVGAVRVGVWILGTGAQVEVEP
jgi:hypothetical protein